MHRAFVITLGRELDGVSEALRATYDYRLAHELLPTNLNAEFLAAPIEAVGNLSHPVELLKENLWDDIYRRLTGLLAYQPGAKNPLFLDVYLVVNFGEHLAANALRVVFEAFLDVIPKDFGTVFPPHRAGERRRWRLIPIVLLPARTESKRPREDAISDTRNLLRELEELSMIDGKRDAPFDRVFIADALISAGVLSLNDLMVQSHNLLHFLLFSGTRRHSMAVQLLESTTPELGSAFACAMATPQVDQFHLELAGRLANEAAESLVPSAGTKSYSPTELISSFPEEHEKTKVELVEFVNQRLALDGVAAVMPLIALFEALDEQISLVFREMTLQTSSSTSTPPAESHMGRNLSIGSLVLMMGAGVFAIAHFSLGWTIVAALGPAAGFIGAAGLVLLLMALVLNARNPKPNVESDKAEREDDLEELTLAAASLQEFQETLLLQLKNLESALRGLPGSVTLAVAAHNSAGTQLSESMFLHALRTPKLEEAAFHSGESGGDARRVATSWIESLGGWRDLLKIPTLLNPNSLLETCEVDYQELGQAVVDDDDCRAELKPPLREFMDMHAGGLPCLLEFESRAHLDVTGIRTILSSAVIAPAALEGTLRPQFVDQDHTSFNSLNSTCVSSDVYIVSASVDIHPDAIAVLNPSE